MSVHRKRWGAITEFLIVDLGTNCYIKPILSRILDYGLWGAAEKSTHLILKFRLNTIKNNYLHGMLEFMDLVGYSKPYYFS